MSLSEIKGERVFEVIAEIVEPIANIAQDEKVMVLFKPAKGETVSESLADRAKVAIPALLNTHKDDVVQILASIEGETPEQYMKTVTLASLVGDVYELLTDEELLSFLSSSEKLKN